MRPKVSILTLVYNREKDLAETLKSIKAQTFKDYEMLVLDVASTDRSVEVAKRTSPEAKIIELKDNVGVANYNTGMRQAKGDYFILVDSDAVIEKGAVAKIVDRFEKCDLDIISFKILDDKTGQMVDNPGHSQKGNDECGYKTGFLNSAALALRREVFEKTEGFNPEYFIYIIEMEFCVRAIKYGFEVRYFPDLVCLHKFGPSEARGMAKYYVSRNWVYFIVQYLPIWLIPLFLTWSIFKVLYDTTKGYGRAGSYIEGFLSGLKKISYYFKKRKVLNWVQLKLFMKTQFIMGGFTNKW